MRIAIVILALLFTTNAFGDDDLALIGVNLIDVTDGMIYNNKTIVIIDGVVSHLGSGDESALPPGIRRVVARDKYVVPGLWDSHVHAFADPDDAVARVLPLFVSYGITRIRDMGATLPNLTRARELLAAKTTIAPKVLVTGPILDGVRQSWYGELQLVMSSADDVSDILATLPVDQLKVYTNLPLPVYEAVTRWAKLHDKPVVGHVPLEVGLPLAAELGQKTIDHLDVHSLQACTPNGKAQFKQWVGVKFQSDYTSYFNFMQTFWRSIDWDICNAAFQTFAHHNGYLVPTLVMETTDRALLPEDVANYLNGRGRDYCVSQLAAIDDVPTDVRDAAYQGIHDTLTRIRLAGVPLLAGTDTPNGCLVPGMSLAWELQRMVNFGLSPLEALQSATLNPARAFGFSPPAVEVGRAAELVLLDVNPLEQIKTLEAPIGVYFEGRWLDQGELQAIRDSARYAMP